MSSSLRSLVVAVLTVGMLTAGLVGPVAAEPAIEVPTTAAATLDGLPASNAGGRTSKQVSTPIPFSMVGFEVPEHATLEFRTSEDGAAWTPWTTAEVEPQEGPDPASAEANAASTRMSQPVWVGEASQLQTRLTGGRPGADASDVGVRLIDSSGLARSLSTRLRDRLRAVWRGQPASAAAMTGRPAIVTRNQWGADERLRSGSPSYSSKITMGIVHHTAGSNDYTRAQADDVVRGVYRYHVQSNGWSDIGYNFLIDRYGTIYEGRYGGVTRAVVGAHAGGFNTNTFGVSLIGSFSGAAPPRAMRLALQRLLAWKYDLHHVNVLGKTTYTSYGSSKYAAGRQVRIDRLSGHRDASITACPGGETYSMLPRLRTRVAEIQGPVILNPAVSPSSVQIVDGQSVSGAMTFKARLRPAGQWTVTVTSSTGTPVHTMTGYGETVAHQWLPAGVQPGTYRYTITAPDRRPATGTVYLRAPEITASASAATTTMDAAGALRPVAFSGTLWDGAQWRLAVKDAAGNRVHLVEGTGEALSASWTGPVTAPGVYTWRVSADGAAAVTGKIQVYADLVERAATSRDPAAAAAAMSRRTFPEPAAKWAVVTPRTSPGLALAAAPVAAGGGPVLYTDLSSVPEATATELQRVLPAGRPLYVLGDQSFVSEASIAQLKTRWDVRRLSGANPAEVAAAALPVVRSRRPDQSAVVLVAGGASKWRQGIAGATYAARNHLPVLLTRTTKLTGATATALADNAVTHVTIIGNEEAIAPAVRQQLPSNIRVAGDSAAQTAVAVSRRLFGRTAAVNRQPWQFANVSLDDGWQRALASVPWGARRNAPLLAAGASAVPGATSRYLGSLGYNASTLGTGTVLGNSSHVSGSVRTALARQLQ